MLWMLRQLVVLFVFIQSGQSQTFQDILMGRSPSFREACESCGLGQYFLPGALTGETGEVKSMDMTGGTVTEPPVESTTWNRFNQAGWMTDDNGNVFIGNDFAKLYLISVGSFWPFPKDYKR